MVLIVPVTPHIDVPIPPSRPADLNPVEAPIPPSRPSDLGNDKPAGDPPTQKNPQQGTSGDYALAEKPPGGPLDIVTLLVNGKQYGGWEKATVTASVDDAHRAFSVTTAEHYPDWPIQPQDEVTVYVNYTDIVCKGVVEVYAAELAENTHVARIDGASASVDAVDSAAKSGKGGAFKPGPDTGLSSNPPEGSSGGGSDSNAGGSGGSDSGTSGSSGSSGGSGSGSSGNGGSSSGNGGGNGGSSGSDGGAGSGDDSSDDGEDDTGRFRDMTIKEIGDQITKDFDFKIIDKTSKGLDKVERFQLQNGETSYDALERIARSQNLFLIGSADGNIEIHDGPEKNTKIALVEGYWPVLKISVKISTKDRFQTTKVRGQRAHSAKGEDLKVEAKVTDKSVKRKRTKVIIAEGDIDTKKARSRALNDVNKQQGDGTACTIEASGWYAPDGKLWRPMQLVYVNFPTVHIDQTMGIKQIVWNKEENGRTYTRLEMVDPKALNGEEDKKSKSSGAFKPGPDTGLSSNPPDTPTSPPTVTPSPIGGRSAGPV